MLHGMMMARRGKRSEVTLACLLLATAGCFADLDEVPQVTVQPASTVQKLGGTVILGCVVEPPWMNITWRLNGKELNGSDDALGVLLTRGTLVIPALSNHTVGRYQCVARMPAGAVASVPATVTLASCQPLPKAAPGSSSSSAESRPPGVTLIFPLLSF
uniref:BOC cell adhesion associated, onco regulated n=1 Tax=Oryctolagus cuniculus TaxID=9986 RepID=A0A5F9D9B1_RABIT